MSQALGTVGLYLVGLTSFAILTWAWLQSLPRTGSHLGLPRIGIDPGFFGQNLAAAKKLFSTQGYKLLLEAYRKHDSNYVVQTEDLPRIVLSPRYLPELDMLPEDTLSHRESISLRHLGQFTAALIPGMSTHVDKALCEFLAKANKKDFTPAPAMGFSFFTIARLFSYVFIGEPLCENKEWMHALGEYPKVMMTVSAALRPWTPWLRPLVARFLEQPKKLKEYQAKLHKLFDPVIDARRGSEGHNDALQWLVSLAAPHEADNHSVLLKLMFLTLAAIHTSAMAMDHVLLDLCARPEYIEPLRQEAREALQSTSGEWTLETLSKLPRLDSFMQESRRYNHPAALGFHRLALKDIPLSNGFTVPKGWVISMFAEALARDATLFKDPDTFDGERFLRKDSVQGEAEFSRILPGNLSWGHGRFTCPGRWYADAQIKLVLAKTLLGYDVRFAEADGKRPENVHADERIAPDPRAMVAFRKL